MSACSAGVCSSSCSPHHPHHLRCRSPKALTYKFIENILETGHRNSSAEPEICLFNMIPASLYTHPQPLQFYEVQQQHRSSGSWEHEKVRDYVPQQIAIGNGRLAWASRQMSDGDSAIRRQGGMQSTNYIVSVVSDHAIIRTCANGCRTRAETQKAQGGKCSLLKMPTTRSHSVVSDLFKLLITLQFSSCNAESLTPSCPFPFFCPQTFQQNSQCFTKQCLEVSPSQETVNPTRANTYRISKRCLQAA